MATPPPPADGRRSPTRNPPRAIATNFFSKSKKDNKPVPIETATATSPRQPKVLAKGDGRRPSVVTTAAEEEVIPSSPVIVPASVSSSSSALSSQPQQVPQAKNKAKLTPSNTFNTHYRSISRSMNDLGNIFSRGRSPPNRDTSPRRPALNTLPEAKKGRSNGPESPRLKNMDFQTVPSISVVQHGESSSKDTVIKEGWVNAVDSVTARKGPLRDAWKLQHAMIVGNILYLYKAPSHLGIRSFDISVPSEAAPVRPQTAPAGATQALDTPIVQHRAVTRHPQIIVDDKNNVIGGTVEALCHEIMFTEEKLFVKGAVITMPAWTQAEHGLAVLTEYAIIQNSATRIGHVVSILLDSAPGLLLDSGYYNSLRLLVEKGVTAHNAQLAKVLREKIEAKAKQIKTALFSLLDPEDGANSNSRSDESGCIDTSLRELGIIKPADSPQFSLTADEFLQISPEHFASQLHLFHLKYVRAWNPADDISLLLMSPASFGPAPRNPLVFTTANLHFLTDKVFQHILSGEAAHSLNLRVAILTHWLEVAELLKRMGDMVGWLAVIMAVSSPAILRLRETWSLIDTGLVELYCKGGRVLMMTLNRRRINTDRNGSEAHVFAPEGIGREVPQGDVVPFFGDLCHCLDDAFANRSTNIDYVKFLQGMKGILRSLEKWKAWFASKVKAGKLEPERTGEDSQLQTYFKELNQANINPPSTLLQSYFDMSMICEPAITGLYLQSHYHQRLPLSIGANLPLIFTDVLPRFSLFDKEDTLAIASGNHQKKSSTGTLTTNPSMSQAANSLHPPSARPLRRVRSFPPSTKLQTHTTGYDVLDFTTRERTAGLSSGDEAMLRTIRDVAGVSQKLFYSKDGELVLKSITEENMTSRPSSVIELTASSRVSVSSRRLSVQLNSTGPSPRISVHAEGGNSQGLSRTDVLNLSIASNPLPVVPKGGTLERLVDILILGVNDFSKRMNSSDNCDSGSQPWLTMDMNVFTVTFFSTFRR